MPLPALGDSGGDIGPAMLLSLCTALLAPTRALLALQRLVARLAVAAAVAAAGVVYGLWGLGVLLRWGPRRALRWRVRAEPPPGLADGTYGEHRHLRLKVGGGAWGSREGFWSGVLGGSGFLGGS